MRKGHLFLKLLGSVRKEERSTIFKISFLSTLILILVQGLFAQGNNIIEIRGQVIDAETKVPLQTVSVTKKELHQVL